MTELEIMEHAKSYLDKMVQGVNPLTGEAVPEADLIRQVRIAKCLDYVSGVLEKVIAHGGNIPRAKVYLQPFSLAPEVKSQFSYSEEAMFISEFTKRVNALTDPQTMKQLSLHTITAWLVREGYLEVAERPDGKKAKVPTQAGLELGILTEHRNGLHGEYEAVLYPLPVQHFLVEHLDEMLAEPDQEK